MRKSLDRLVRLVALVSLVLLVSTAAAQDIRYETDEQCGCDIMLVNGFETTKETDSTGTVRYGFRHENGTVIAPNRYKYVDTFKGGYCRVWLEDTLAGLIDSTGHEVVPCLYSAVDLPSENRIWVARDGLHGYTDLEGNIVIPLRYANASPFSEGRASVAVVLDSFTVLCTYIDTLGTTLFEPIYQSALPYRDGYAAVYRYDRWGIIDRDEHQMLPNIYEQISTPDHGTFFAGDEWGMALFDYSFRPLTPQHYIPITTVSDRRIGVLRGDKYGFLDLKGHEAVPCIYDEIGRFHLGRAMVRLGDRYGIIDTSGTLILPLQYHNSKKKSGLYTYHDSLALVEQDGQYGYVDLQGRLVIPFYFNGAFPFSQGLASVRVGSHWGYIDTRGDIYLPFIFDIASPFEHGRAEIIFNGDIRYIDRQGRCVKNCGGIISFR